jgi:hypothetical protein
MTVQLFSHTGVWVPISPFCYERALVVNIFIFHCPEVLITWILHLIIQILSSKPNFGWRRLWGKITLLWRDHDSLKFPSSIFSTHSQVLWEFELVFLPRLRVPILNSSFSLRAWNKLIIIRFWMWARCHILFCWPHGSKDGWLLKLICVSIFKFIHILTYFTLLGCYGNIVSLLDVRIEWKGRLKGFWLDFHLSRSIH